MERHPLTSCLDARARVSGRGSGRGFFVQQADSARIPFSLRRAPSLASLPCLASPVILSNLTGWPVSGLLSALLRKEVLLRGVVGDLWELNDFLTRLSKAPFLSSPFLPSFRGGVSGYFSFLSLPSFAGKTDFLFVGSFFHGIHVSVLFTL